LAVQSGPDRGASPLTFTITLVPVTVFDAEILAGVPLSASEAESGVSAKIRKVSEDTEANFLRNMRAALQRLNDLSMSQVG
jgi:hypothetical protein